MASKSRTKINQITILKALVFLIAGLITVRLFSLQVLSHELYIKKAAKDHYGSTEIPARRGEIFIKDYASGETVRVATNITLDTLFADPTIIQNPKLVADRIIPLIYNPEETRTQDRERIKTESKRAKSQEELKNIKALTDEELYKKFYDETLQKISQKTRSVILLNDGLAPATLEEIAKLNLSGLEISEKELKAHPIEINSHSYVASQISKYLDISPARLEEILEGKNRYVILRKKLQPEVSAEIEKIIREDQNKNFLGLGLKEEYYRFYPEETLAANALGFVTPQGLGQYGIESKFNNQLQGKKGLFQGQKDGSIHGRQITVGDSVIQPAVDGDNIVLTIDRAMQMEVERLLAKGIKDYRADSGQAIVMDPKTGRIIAMAHYPSFDPNNFSAALDTEEINFTAGEIKNLVPITGEENAFWFYRNVPAEDRFKVFRETLSNNQTIYKHFKNWIGLEAYQNKAVSAPYEPGSVFKTISMASALDDKDVTPNTAFNDPGRLELDWNVYSQKYDYVISNVSPKCTGYVNMTRILENSCNTGIGFVAKKMGRNLFYSYMVKFGFGERTGIEFDNENPGKIEHFTRWSESELVTHAFGQGITATPLQMLTAYAAIANKGLLMQPHIVEKIIEVNGKTVQNEVSPVQRVISEQIAHTVTAMLVNAVESGVARNAKLPNYYIAAKTGTSQTYKHGKPVSGVGTTITSIAGFGPIDSPQFALIVKMDRPRTSEWADATAAHTFREIAAYLYEYLGVPPDKK